MIYAILGAFVLIVPLAFDNPPPSWIYPLGLFALVSGGYVFWRSLSSSRDMQASNEHMKMQYESDVAEYSLRVQAAEEKRERKIALIPQIENKISKLSQKRNEANKLLDLAYNANIIPNHYRNIYVAVFLYDWFSTSGADDLDMALNMFVLEEIKAKLDRIIEQQADIILNQRIMIANQERIAANQRKSIDIQMQHRQMMYKKMDRLQATEEERLRYTKMIESNTAATAYFAAANYLK